MALTEKGCAPTAIIVGEGTRLFRDPQWMHTFCRSLWDAGVRIFFGNFGEVTPQTISGAEAMTTALSAQLPEAVRGARRARKQAGRLYCKKIQFGLLASDDGSEVYAHPEQWPIVREMVVQVAANELQSQAHICEWLLEQHGVRRTHGWVRQIFFLTRILDGYYDAFRVEGEVRKLRQRPWSDLDFTEGGHRRYRRWATEDPLVLPINFAHFGQHPLPPEIVAQARNRINNRRGRPSTGRPAGSFLMGRYTRCAVCGHALREVLRAGKWSVRCCCMDTLRMRYSARLDQYLSRQAVEKLEEFIPHPRCCPLDEPLSEKVWRLLVHELENHHDKIPADALDGNAESNEHARLRREIAALDEQLDVLLENMVTTRLTDAARERLEKRQEEISAALDARQRELNTLTTTMIQRRQQSEAMQRFHQMMRAYHAHIGTDDAARQELIELVVKQIVVHLEERWFRIEVDTDLPTLQTLEGRLDRHSHEVEKDTIESWSTTRRTAMR